MTRFFPFGTVSVCILIFSALDANARYQYGEYEYLVIVMHWPNSLCNALPDGCDSKLVPQKFKIRNFWPMYFPDKIVPEFNDSGCNISARESIDREILGEVEDELDVEWPSIAKKGRRFNLRHWRKSWKRNGRCFEQPNNPKHFFNVSMTLSKALSNILTFLREDVRQIVPKDGWPYHRNHIFSAIRKRLGKSATIGCNKDVDGNEQFSDVRQCLHKNGSRKACIDAYANCNGTKLIFPHTFRFKPPNW